MPTNSKALARVKNHKRGGTTTQEGVWLRLDQLEALAAILRTTTSENGATIDAVAFMVGQLASGKKTVEILPFDYNHNQLLQVSGKLGALVGLLWDNEDGGAGGNQKTPPPSIP
jgi:hypothetical protein